MTYWWVYYKSWSILPTCPPVDARFALSDYRTAIARSLLAVEYFLQVNRLILHYGTLQYMWHDSHDDISADSDYWEAIVFRFLLVGALLFRCMSKPLPPYNILKASQALVILNFAVPPKRWLCISTFLWFGLWGGTSLRIENLLSLSKLSAGPLECISFSRLIRRDKSPVSLCVPGAQQLSGSSQCAVPKFDRKN